jgi:hypothetical protein
MQETLKSTRNVTANGINFLDLIDSQPVDSVDFAKAKQFLKSNYGVQYDEPKFVLLFDIIKEEKWSSARFQKTLIWFLKNKKYPSWTVADWFEYGEKLYPYSWYLEQINNGTSADNLEGYRINGVVLWKLKDGQDLPFEKI